MNRTTSLDFTSLSMNCSIDIAVFPFGGADRTAADSILKASIANIVSKSRQSYALISFQASKYRWQINRQPVAPARTKRSTDRAKMVEIGRRGAVLRFRRAGLQGQSVQLAAHFALERIVDDFVLLHARFAAEGLGDDRCGIMVAVAG